MMSSLRPKYSTAIPPASNVAVLCTQKNSVYESISGAVCFDSERDAFSFRGGMPVIAHPPCRLWASLKGQAKSRSPEREKELGRHCAWAVIQNGGFLEHPFNSKLFEDMGLPIGGCENELGFTIEFPQRWFGHSMIKNTWLFCSRCKLEALPPFRPALDGPCRTISQLSHKQREATPLRMAHWLVSAVRSSLVHDRQNGYCDQPWLGG